MEGLIASIIWYCLGISKIRWGDWNILLRYWDQAREWILIFLCHYWELSMVKKYIQHSNLLNTYVFKIARLCDFIMGGVPRQQPSGHCQATCSGWTQCAWESSVHVFSCGKQAAVEQLLWIPFFDIPIPCWAMQGVWTGVLPVLLFRTSVHQIGRGRPSPGQGAILILVAGDLGEDWEARRENLFLRDLCMSLYD